MLMQVLWQTTCSHCGRRYQACCGLFLLSFVLTVIGQGTVIEGGQEVKGTDIEGGTPVEDYETVIKAPPPSHTRCSAIVALGAATQQFSLHYTYLSAGRKDAEAPTAARDRPRDRRHRQKVPCSLHFHARTARSCLSCDGSSRCVRVLQVPQRRD